MADTFNAGDIVDKTLIADVDIPVYDSANTNRKLIGHIKAGQPVGVVYSWIAANPAEGRNNIWWMFWPPSNYGKFIYAPHNEGYYNIAALKQQGVLTLQEKQEAEELANLPWYERLIRQYGIWIVGGVVAAAAVKGYLSRPQKTSV